MDMAPSFYGRDDVSFDYETGHYIASQDAPQAVKDAVKAYNYAIDHPDPGINT